jgi:hypothetical protein
MIILTSESTIEFRIEEDGEERMNLIHESITAQIAIGSLLIYLVSIVLKR